MEEERDVVVFTDDDGNEFELDVIDYFEHEDQEYAVLIDAAEDDCDDEECQHEVYIMKIITNGDTEEFVPADEDKLDALAAIVEQRFSECDCDCDDEECHHDHHEGCDCGCHHEK